MNNSTETPLTEATYFILLSLSPKSKHGYAIMKDVQELSEGRVGVFHIWLDIMEVMGDMAVYLPGGQPVCTGGFRFENASGCGEGII